MKAYLFAITGNLFRDSTRKDQRFIADDELRNRQDPRPRPELNVQDRQNLGNVLNAIQRLPEQQREALVLAADQEMSYEEIAAILGCSVAAIKVRVHRARVALKSELRRKEPICKT